MMDSLPPVLRHVKYLSFAGATSEALEPPLKKKAIRITTLRCGVMLNGDTRDTYYVESKLRPRPEFISLNKVVPFHQRAMAA